MQTVIDIITALRNIRAQWNVKPGEMVDAFLVMDGLDRGPLEESREDISRLAKLRTLTLADKPPVVRNAATALVERVKIYIPLEGVVDLNAEKGRINAEIAQKQKAADSLRGRLGNADFMSQAKEEIIAKEKERLQTLENQLGELKNVLANLL